jgi:phosphoribosylformimino-5-aminoimidazole carboxamide ribotide isomerase
MEVIPAIDLRGGKCVRLYQGDYNQETVFSENPVNVAMRWQALSAPRLHIVDLDGAARGMPCNIPVIEEILHAIQIPAQIGGGIRHLETIEKLLQVGIQRVILGTAAVEDIELVREACQRFGEAIVIGVDAKDDYIATHGWQERTNVTIDKLVVKMTDLGVKRLIYTDVSRDGTLTQPNFGAIAELVASTDLSVIASGGISSISHLRQLNQLGVEGAIVGRALYTGDIDLKEALAAL